MNRSINKQERGFTILELLIATTVLSVILLLVTTMMISIGNLYYKGFNQARVQDGTRSLVDEVSKQLEFNDIQPQHGYDTHNPAIQVYCMGDTRYSYVMNTLVGQSKAGLTYSHVLWRDNNPGCTPTSGADLTQANLSGGTELIPPHSRLTGFCIGTFDSATNACKYTTTSPFPIAASVAYGDDDLLCDSSVPTDCGSTTETPHMQNLWANTNETTPGPIAPFGSLVCKGNTGEQFCATAQLSITVAKRVQ